MASRARLSGWLVVTALLCLVACREQQESKRATREVGGKSGPMASAPAARQPRWAKARVPGAGETLALRPDGARPLPVTEARAAGLLDVDLGDDWAPFIFSDSDAADATAKPNAYRRTFVDLANDRLDPEDASGVGGQGPTRQIDTSPEAEARRRAGKPEKPEETKSKAPRRKRVGPVRNYLEVYGIPPTLTVLLARVEEDAGKSCHASLDVEGLRLFTGEITYQNAKQARRDFEELAGDVQWASARQSQLGDAGASDAGVDERTAARLTRLERGLLRQRAIRAAQGRLLCEGLLTARSRHVDGMFDLPTHEALARWERKNDIFGWGFLGGETLSALARPPLELHFETFQRILTERVADAAGVIEDGTIGSKQRPATYKGTDGTVHRLPNLIAEHVSALREALEIQSPEDMVRFLTLFKPGLPGLHVAFPPPALPPYYSAHMDLEVEIDRGDVWYDFPFDGRGEPVTQKRERYPHLTLLVRWNQQRIPLARWRTTIGSWRSELDAQGRLAYKYKNSDVGPRIWKHLVAAPVWIPPESTPGKDLLTKKTFDVRVGPVDVVNTEVMGPGFQSAYGLVMAIHHKVTAGGGLFDNQIRTHGSVDYTSIARRFSHGCHRLVNTRAVRLFSFVLRRRTYVRQGDNTVAVKRFFRVDGDQGERRFGFELTTRGYYYELRPPLPVNVLEGRIAGNVKKPITDFVPKPGVDYRADSRSEPAVVEAVPVLGP